MSHFSRFFAIALVASSLSLSAVSWQDFLSYFPDEFPAIYEMDESVDYSEFQQSFGPDWEVEAVREIVSTIGYSAKAVLALARKSNRSAIEMFEQLHAQHSDDFKQCIEGDADGNA